MITGCLPVVQLLLKWRRGRSSARPVEDAIRKLQACGMQQFWAESYAMRNKTTTPEAKAKPLLFDILDFYRPL